LEFDLITVAIDTQHTRQTNAGGARYSDSLAIALRGIEDLEVIELGRGPLVPRGTLRKKILTARQEFLWYPWLGRRQARRLGANVYHCPTLRAPLTRGSPPLVVTVHDLVPLLAPDTMTRWNRLYTRATVRKVLHSADLIIASSQNTADDLVSLLQIAPERIRVIWIGVDEIFLAGAVSHSRVTPEPYVLFVGTPEPRKNLHRLIEAMAQLRERGFAHRLVIAGAGGWGNVRIGEEQALSLGRVSDEQLVSLYADASCLALPSLHEGFGLTAVEAMAVGTPVVAGRAGALPEITGNAAVLVDPYDSAAISQGIERAIEDRDKLVTLGRLRAGQFKWARAAAAIAAVYREVA
jgi:glycosyltransferase involved in cell wall biosynthesis